MTDTIAVSHYVDSSFYPNAGHAGAFGDDPDVQRVYWECISLLAASARRWGDEDLRVEVYTNGAPPDELRATLDAFGVRLVDLPVRYVVPPGFADQYVACFYRFDLVEHFAETLAGADRAVIVDADCVFVDRVGRLFDRLDRDGLLAHTIHYEPRVRRHGRTRADLARMVGEDTGAWPDPPPAWVGGELIGLTPGRVPALVELIRRTWDASLARFARGEEHVGSDEHLWSIVFWELGWREGNAGDLVKRLYTSTRPLPRNVSADPARHELALALWHLPGEKVRGLRRLARECRSPDSALLALDDDAYRHHVARVVGVTPSAPRWVGDQLVRARRIPRRVRTALAR